MDKMRRPVIDAIMDNVPFCWVNDEPDSVLYRVWLHWQVRNVE